MSYIKPNAIGNSQDFTGLVVIAAVIAIVIVIAVVLVISSQKNKNRHKILNLPTSSKYSGTCQSFSLYRRLLNRREGFATWQCQNCGLIIDVLLTLDGAN